MKKFLSILLTLTMLFGLAAMAEEPSNTSEVDFLDEQPEASKAFDGIWQCDRATLEMYWEEEGFRVLISWGSSAWEHTEWEYSGYYYEDSNTVITLPLGSRTDFVYGDNGELVSATTVYEDGSAVFGMTEEGMLTWTDEKENAGEGMLFEKISDVALDEESLDEDEGFVPMPAEAAAFEGVWQRGDTTIEMFWEELGFKVLVQKSGNASVVAEWEYSCYYHENDNTVVALPFGIHGERIFNESGDFVTYNEIYTDGEATFALTEDGFLTWTDEMDNAGEGMLFEKVTEEDEFSDEDFGDESEPMPEEAAAFEGVWQCGDTTIEMFWEELGFKVLVQKSGNALVVAEWEYSCYYHEEDNTVVSLPFGIHGERVFNESGDFVTYNEFYNDGEATFSLTEDGFLTWADEMDNAGEGMLFEKLPE